MSIVSQFHLSVCRLSSVTNNFYLFGLLDFNHIQVSKAYNLYTISKAYNLYTMVFSTLYHEFVCHVEHYSVELDT